MLLWPYQASFCKGRLLEEAMCLNLDNSSPRWIWLAWNFPPQLRLKTKMGRDNAVQKIKACSTVSFEGKTNVQADIFLSAQLNVDRCLLKWKACRYFFFHMVLYLLTVAVVFEGNPKNVTLRWSHQQILSYYWYTSIISERFFRYWFINKKEFIESWTSFTSLRIITCSNKSRVLPLQSIQS